MKKRTENMTLSYEPERVEGTNIELSFTKSVQGGNVHVNGKLKRGEESLGMVGYSTKDGYIIFQIKPLDEETERSIAKIFAKIGDCLEDLIGE